MVWTDSEKESITFKDLPKDHSEGRGLQSKPVSEPSKPLCKHKPGCFHHAFKSFFRTFLAAYIVKFAASVLPSLASGKVLKNFSLLKSSAGKDTLRFSLFMSLFVGGYKSVLCLLRKVRGKDDKMNAFISGLVAGLLLILDEKSRRLSAALYISARAAEFTYTYYMKRNYLPKIPHTDAILMALSGSQILYASYMEPDCLAKSYLNFLLYHGGVTKYKTNHKEYMSDIANLIRGENVDIMKHQEVFHNHPVALEILNRQSNTCKLHAFSHPDTESCLSGNSRFLLESLPRTLSLYIPLNLVMGMFFRHKLLMNRPDQFLLKAVSQAARSSMFLSMSSLCAWAVPCSMRNMLGFDHIFSYYLSGFLGGLCVLIEAKSRRLELAMYCAPRAFESFWNCLVKWGYLKNIKNGEVLYFSLSTGFLMMIYENEPETLNSAFKSVMTRLFGIN